MQSDLEIRSLLEVHLRALNDRDLDKLLSLYADDAVLEFPASPPAQGIDRIRQAFQSFFDQWEELSTYQTVIVAGTVAAVEGTAVGHHRTLHLRIPGRVSAGSREYRHDFAMFVEFSDGKRGVRGFGSSAQAT